MDNTEIQQIIPCSGWSFKHENHNAAPSIYPVAAWALLKSGEVVGLIPVSNATAAGNVARLVAPPPLAGTYLPDCPPCFPGEAGSV